MRTSGAEAIIVLNDDNNIDKSRIQKNYRIQEIDVPLRISRTKKEAKILKTLQKIIPVPKLFNVTEYNIEMEYVDGVQLKKILDVRPELSELIGKNLALMHDNGIMHGDLTTSNMILKEVGNEEKLYFIDFGLSFNSSKIEDKAVDIHLFKQALESRHFRIAEVAYKEFLKGYYPKDRKEVLSRLRVVEERGRYKEKT
ncbi:MAG: KEOPS complex kinase/ATPase Bud32 [Candidatus Woesearchaeota archaeon]